MNSEHKEKLLQDVKQYIKSYEKPPVLFDSLLRHVIDKGWQILDEKMFESWVKKNFKDVEIEY